MNASETKSRFSRVILCFLLAQALLNFEAQAKDIDSLKMVLKRTVADSAKIQILLEIAETQEKQLFNYSEAYLYYDDVRKLSKKIGDTLHLGIAVFRQGVMLLEMEEFKASNNYFRSILRVGQNINNKELLQKGNLGLGLYYKTKRKYDEALKHFDLALNSTSNTLDSFCRAELYFLKSQTYFEKQDFKNSHIYCNKAINSLEKQEVPLKYTVHQLKIALKKESNPESMSLLQKTYYLAEYTQDYKIQLEVLDVLIEYYQNLKQLETSSEWIIKKEEVKKKAPNFLNKEHLNEVIFAHAYDKEINKSREATQKKERKNIGLYIVLFLLGAILLIILKRQYRIKKLSESLLDAQMKFVKEKRQQYK